MVTQETAHCDFYFLRYTNTLTYLLTVGCTADLAMDADMWKD